LITSSEVFIFIIFIFIVDSSNAYTIVLINIFNDAIVSFKGYLIQILIISVKVHDNIVNTLTNNESLFLN